MSLLTAVNFQGNLKAVDTSTTETQAITSCKPQL